MSCTVERNFCLLESTAIEIHMMEGYCSLLDIHNGVECICNNTKSSHTTTCIKLYNSKIVAYSCKALSAFIRRRWDILLLRTSFNTELTELFDATQQNGPHFLLQTPASKYLPIKDKIIATIKPSSVTEVYESLYYGCITPCDIPDTLVADDDDKHIKLRIINMYVEWAVYKKPFTHIKHYHMSCIVRLVETVRERLYEKYTYPIPDLILQNLFGTDIIRQI